MNTPILNRSAELPADGWYEIETPGEHLNAGARVIQQLDGQAFDSIVNRFQQEKTQPNFAGLLIDRDHFSTDADKPSDALGWGLDLRNRDGHLEAKVDWTSAGDPLVKGKVFKFFSTVYEPQDLQKVGEKTLKNRTYPVVRPLRLDRLALTNDPNNKGGKPISNRQPAATAERSEKQPTSKMKSVLKMLGLADDASEESAVAAVQKIQNRAAQADGLQTERDALLGTQIDADLEKFKAVIKNPEAIRKQLIANRASMLELLENLQVPPAGAEPEVAAAARPAALTNRAKAATPGAKEAEKEAAANSLATRVQNRALQIQREKSASKRLYSFSTAFNEAAAELSAAGK